MQDSTFINTSSFRVVLNGKSLDPWIVRTIQGISVVDELNRPSMFTLKLALLVHVNQSSSRGETLFNVDDSFFDQFAPGATVDIYMGAPTQQRLVSGVVTALDSDFDNISLLEITGFDRLYYLRLGKNTKSYENVRDSDMVREIAGTSSLRTDVGETEFVHPYVIQNNISDYAFLLERADRLGYEISVDDFTLSFRESAENEQPELSLTFGRELHSFSASMKALEEGSDFEVRGWDYRSRLPVSGTASAGDETYKMIPGSSPRKTNRRSGFEISREGIGPSSLSVVNDTVQDEKEAESIARAGYNRMLHNFVRGEGKTEGNTSIRKGRTLALKGLGPKFSGVYYVTSSTHTWDREGYITKFKVRRTVI